MLDDQQARWRPITHIPSIVEEAAKRPRFFGVAFISWSMRLSTVGVQWLPDGTSSPRHAHRTELLTLRITVAIGHRLEHIESASRVRHPFKHDQRTRLIDVPPCDLFDSCDALRAMTRFYSRYNAGSSRASRKRCQEIREKWRTRPQGQWRGEKREQKVDRSGEVKGKPQPAGSTLSFLLSTALLHPAPRAGYTCGLRTPIVRFQQQTSINV